MNLFDELDELASAYIDGETTIDETARVESTPDLLARVEELRAMSEAVGAPVTAPPAAVRDAAIAAALDASLTQPNVTSLDAARNGAKGTWPSRRVQRQTTWERIGRTGALAAAAVAGIVVVGFAINSLRSPGTEFDTAASVPASDEATADTSAGSDSASTEATDGSASDDTADTSTLSLDDSASSAAAAADTLSEEPGVSELAAETAEGLSDDAGDSAAEQPPAEAEAVAADAEAVAADEDLERTGVERFEAYALDLGTYLNVEALSDELAVSGLFLTPVDEELARQMGCVDELEELLGGTPLNSLDGSAAEQLSYYGVVVIAEITEPDLGQVGPYTAHALRLQQIDDPEGIGSAVVLLDVDTCSTLDQAPLS